MQRWRPVKTGVQQLSYKPSFVQGRWQDITAGYSPVNPPKTPDHRCLLTCGKLVVRFFPFSQGTPNLPHSKITNPHGYGLRCRSDQRIINPQFKKQAVTVMNAAGVFRVRGSHAMLKANSYVTFCENHGFHILKGEWHEGSYRYSVGAHCKFDERIAGYICFVFNVLWNIICSCKWYSCPIKEM